MVLISPVWPAKVRKLWPFFASQRRTVLSLLPVASVRPSLLNAMALTDSLWPSSLCLSVNVLMSWILATWSTLPVANVVLSGLKATHRMPLAWVFIARWTA